MRSFDFQKEENFFRTRAIIFSVALLFVAFFSLSDKALAASLSISPSAAEYSVGQTFSENVSVDSGGQAINAVSGTISFSPSVVKVVSISEGSSIINFWATQPSFSNAAGSIDFEGVVLNPGFSGSSGNVITVNFMAEAAGQSSLSFSSGSVLANDGLGTNVLSSMNSSAVSVVSSDDENAVSTQPGINPLTPPAPEVTSTTNPDPNGWYATSSPSFSWPVSDDVTAVRLLYGNSPTSVPDVEYSPPISTKTLNNIADGVYYFHVQLKNDNGWGGISHYRFAIDTTPPEPFTISFPSATSGPAAIVSFKANDNMSGIDHYSIQIDNQNVFDVNPSNSGDTYTLPVESAGSHTLIVTAFDKAGNSTVATANFSVTEIKVPEISSYTKELSSDGVMAIRGTTYPDSSVSVFIRSAGVLEDTEKTQSDANGDFVLAISKSLSSGAYEFTAQVTDGSGAESAETAPYDFSVGQNPLVWFGEIVINYTSIIIIAALLLALIIGLSWRVVRKISTLKQEVKKEVGQAESILHKSFDLLKEDINEHVQSLLKAKTRRDLTKEEELFLKKFGSNLSEAETIIAKEIRNLNDLK